MQKTVKFRENIEVLEVVPKSAPLKTSLDVFKARKLLELARVSALVRNAVARHSEGADSAADLRALTRKPQSCHESIACVREYGIPRAGSAWELKIVTERREKRENHDLEDEGERRS